MLSAFFPRVAPPWRSLGGGGRREYIFKPNADEGRRFRHFVLVFENRLLGNAITNKRSCARRHAKESVDGSLRRHARYRTARRRLGFYRVVRASGESDHETETEKKKQLTARTLKSMCSTDAFVIRHTMGSNTAASLVVVVHRDRRKPVRSRYVTVAQESSRPRAAGP